MVVELTTGDEATAMTKMEAHLVGKKSETYAAYMNGKMSFELHGQAWKAYVEESFPGLAGKITSENIFASVVGLYAENLIPTPDELSGFSNSIVPLLTRGECVVVVDSAGTPHFPEHFEMVSDGRYTIACVFTRSLEKMLDYITFVYGDGTSRVFSKPVPEDLAPAAYETGFTFVAQESGHKLFRFALDDKGFGGSLASLQDRVNHSIIDLTVVAEMYARPFWYLLNFEAPPVNPYLPAGSQTDRDAMHENKTDGGNGRVFTTSSEGPFGQLEPPTIQDMIAYHDSIIDKIPQSFGIPGHYFRPGTGTPPTGVALKVLSKRFNNRISRMREDIEEILELLAEELGIEKTGEDEDGEKVYEFWPEGDDLLQESLDAHGISLSTMGYPLEYIASVVTPGVDLDDYAEDEALAATGPAVPGEPVDMTAMGQQGTPATPGQVEAYRQSPGQRAKAGS